MKSPKASLKWYRFAFLSPNPWNICDVKGVHQGRAKMGYFLRNEQNKDSSVWMTYSGFLWIPSYHVLEDHFWFQSNIIYTQTLALSSWWLSLKEPGSWDWRFHKVRMHKRKLSIPPCWKMQKEEGCGQWVEKREEKASKGSKPSLFLGTYITWSSFRSLLIKLLLKGMFFSSTNSNLILFQKWTVENIPVKPVILLDIAGVLGNECK